MQRAPHAPAHTAPELVGRQAAIRHADEQVAPILGDLRGGSGQGEAGLPDLHGCKLCQLTTQEHTQHWCSTHPPTAAWDATRRQLRRLRPTSVPNIQVGWSGSASTVTSWLWGVPSTWNISCWPAGQGGEAEQGHPALGVAAVTTSSCGAAHIVQHEPGVRPRATSLACHPPTQVLRGLGALVRGLGLLEAAVEEALAVVRPRDALPQSMAGAAAVSQMCMYSPTASWHALGGG